MFQSKKQKIAAIGATAAAVLIGVGATAYGAVPDSGTGVITGCRNTSTGALRVIDYQGGERCKSGEQRIQSAVVADVEA